MDCTPQVEIEIQLSMVFVATMASFVCTKPKKKSHEIDAQEPEIIFQIDRKCSEPLKMN